MSKKNRKKENISKAAETVTAPEKTISSKERKLTILFCAICYIIVMFVQTEPLSPFNEPPATDDYAYHYLRTEALAQKMRDNAFFNGGIDYLFNNGAGYASSTAYPDFFLIIPACLRLMGMSVGNSMSAFIIICSILTYITTFISVKGITKSPVCASIACTLLMLTSYRMDNIYIRYALGEVQAYVFWPLIIYGLYNLVSEDFKKPYLLGIGIAGMLLTHTISAAIAAGVCVLVFLIYIREIFRTPKKLPVLIITAAATLGLTAYFWLPLLEFLKSCVLVYRYPYTLSEYNKVAFFNLFRDIGIIGIGIMLFAFQLPRFLLLKNSEIRKSLESQDENFRPVLKFADVSLILGLIIVYMTSDKAPWSVLRHFLNFMQFPWRLHGASTVLLSFSAAFYIYSLLKHANLKNTGIIAVMLASCLNAYIHVDAMNYKKIPAFENDHYMQADNTYEMGFAEWLPAQAKQSLKDNGEEFKRRTSLIIADCDRTISGTRSAGTVRFEMPDYHCEYVDVPFIWYKGYKATDSSGKELDITMSDMGFVRVNTAEADGTVEVKFHISALTAVSYVITFLTAAGLVIVLILSIMKKKKTVTSE